MRKYNISANLVRTIEQLYDKATSAVQMNDSIGEWFRTTVGVRQGTNLQFANDIDALTEEEQEREALVESLDKTCSRYKMEISAEKTKLITNSANCTQKAIKIKGMKLSIVTSFK